MKNSLQKRLSLALNQLTGMKLFSERRADVLLFDSATAASDIAFMIGGQWDGCNGIVMPSSDKVAINTAANLVGASRCHQVAMVVARLIAPCSKLATARSLNEQTCTSTLGEMLGVEATNQLQLYEAMDWLNQHSHFCPGFCVQSS